MSADRTHGIGRAPSGRGAKKYHLVRHDRKTQFVCKIERNSRYVRPLKWDRRSLEEWVRRFGEETLCSNCLTIARRDGP